MAEVRRSFADESKVNAEAKKGLTTSRRRMIAVSLGGVALAIPGFSALYRWANSKRINITIEGPFQSGSYTASELPVKMSEEADWFSVDGLAIGSNSIEPSADLTLKLRSAPDLPKKPVQVDGRIIGRSGETLASATESHDASGILSRPREITVGMSTGYVVPTIEHYICFSQRVRLHDISRIEWEMRW